MPEPSFSNVLFWQPLTISSYYDLDEYNGVDVCAASNGGPFASNWAIDTGINDGVTYCQGDVTTAWTLKSLNSNRIVAMDYSMVSADKAKWCGKEVQIFGADGKEITIDEGPFVLFDGCAACMTEGIIDVSAKAFAAIKGGNCGGNNPTGLTVKILDRSVSPSGSVAGGAPVTQGAAAPTTTEAAPTTQGAATPTTTEAVPTTEAAPTTATTTATPETAAEEPTASIRGAGAWWNKDSSASATPSAAATDIPNGVLEALPPSVSAPTAASAAIPEESKEAQVESGQSCEYGKWSCSGKNIQVCSYTEKHTVDWVTVGGCDNSCDTSSSGSIICL
jgi:hypothetical protein